MAAPAQKTAFIADWASRVTAALAARNNLTPDEVQDMVLRLDKLRDETLKGYMATLLGWGDAERAEIEHFVLVAIEVMKQSRPSVIRSAMNAVDLKHRLIQLRNAQAD